MYCLKVDKVTTIVNHYTSDHTIINSWAIFFLHYFEQTVTVIVALDFPFVALKLLLVVVAELQRNQNCVIQSTLDTSKWEFIPTTDISK